MTPLVTIEMLDQPEQVQVGDWVPIRAIVSRPAKQTGAVAIPVAGIRCLDALVNTDLLTQDIDLKPGDRVCLNFSVCFETTGACDMSRIVMQVNPVDRPDHERAIVPFPGHSFRVVPSLDRAVSISLSRVCSYDDAVKLEVVVQNSSALDLTEFEFHVEPQKEIRSGPLCRREPRLRMNETIRFDLVTCSPEVQFQLAATVNKEIVKSERTFRVPSIEQSRSDDIKPFVFLEPRALTTDRITLAPEGKQGAEVIARGGIFPVSGGKSRYVLTVFPSNPNATSVRLYSAAGRVEVESFAKSGRQWPFLITIVDNPILTELIRLDYDVQVSGAPLRGELYLSVRPTMTKKGSLAATAGAALTAKGMTAVLPALFKAENSFEGFFENIGVILTKNAFDLLQLLSILVIYVALWTIDQFWRQFQEA